MALVPSSRYPAQTDVAAGYPQGKARNATSFNDGTGTPLERDWINDVWGFLQALLASEGVTPSGDPDEVGASDYLDALNSFVAAGVEGAALSNFTAQTSGVATGLEDVFWDDDNSQFVAVGASGVILTSPDGITWTSRTSGVATELNGIGGNSSILVAVGASGVILTSPDGITWTSRTSGVATALEDVWWQASSSLFVAVGASGVILTSPDGVTWTSRTSGLAVTIFVVGGDSSSIIVAGASGGAIVTSPDGVTWTSRTSGTANGLGGIAWSPKLSLFAMAATNGTIITSPDGITWTTQTSGTAQLLRGMAWAAHHFVAVGNSGACQMSRDGVNWTLADIMSGTLTEPAWSGRAMVIAGGSGLITKSNRVAA